MTQYILLLIKILGCSFVFYLIWRMFGEVLFLYAKAKKIFGADKVHIIYRPFTSYMELMKQSERLYEHSHGNYHRIVVKYPETKLIFVKVLGVTFLYVVDSQMIKVTSNKMLVELERLFHIPFLNEVGQGLLFSKGQKWKKSRRLISDLFHFDRLQNQQKMITDIVNKKINSLDGQSPDLLQLCKQISAEVVLINLLGQDFAFVQFKKGQKSPFVTLQTIVSAALQQNLKMHYLIRALIFGHLTKDSYFMTPQQKRLINQLLHLKSVVRTYILNQRQKLKQSNNVSPFIKAYQNQNSGEAIQEIIQQIISFMIAGTDTTGSLMHAMICHLAAYPQYQQKIAEDLQNHKQNIHASPELNNFINEVLRLRGSVQMGGLLQVIKSFEIQKFIVPKNTFVINCYGGAAKSPLYWDDSLQFNPDRHKQRNQSINHWFPFGVGPRNCIGKHMALIETRILISKLITQFKIQKIGNSLAMGSDFVVNVIKDRHFAKFVKK